MIDFNKPPYVGNELEYIRQAVENRKICGDGPFTKRCNAWLDQRHHGAGHGHAAVRVEAGG